MNIASPRLYRIQSEPSHFYTGHLDDGVQAFMSLDTPKLIAVLFDLDGKFIEYRTKDLSRQTQQALIDLPVNEILLLLGDDWKELEDWTIELGLRDQVIAVQKFFLPELELGIQDLPTIYQEILDEGGAIDEDTKEDILYWQEGSDFVLVWGNEYYMSADGQVLST